MIKISNFLYLFLFIVSSATFLHISPLYAKPATMFIVNNTMPIDKPTPDNRYHKNNDSDKKLTPEERERRKRRRNGEDYNSDNSENIDPIVIDATQQNSNLADSEIPSATLQTQISKLSASDQHAVAQLFQKYQENTADLQTDIINTKSHLNGLLKQTFPNDMEIKNVQNQISDDNAKIFDERVKLSTALKKYGINYEIK